MENKDICGIFLKNRIFALRDIKSASFGPTNSNNVDKSAADNIYANKSSPKGIGLPSHPKVWSDN